MIDSIFQLYTREGMFISVIILITCLFTPLISRIYGVRLNLRLWKFYSLLMVAPIIEIIKIIADVSMFRKKITVMFMPSVGTEGSGFKTITHMFGNGSLSNLPGSPSISESFVIKIKDLPGIAIGGHLNMSVSDICGLLASILPIIWLAGVLIWAVIYLVVYIDYNKKLLSTRTVYDFEKVAEVLGEFAIAGSGGELSIYTSPIVHQPFIMGIRKPALYISEESYSPEEFEMIMAHEMMHHRERDIVWKLIAQTALILNWYNPVAYLLFKRLNADMEINCDNAVIQSGNHTFKASYGDLLLKEIRTGKPAMYFSINLSGDSKQMERRIKNLFNYKKHRSSKVIFAVLVIVVMLIGTLCVFGKDMPVSTPDSMPEDNMIRVENNIEGTVDENEADAVGSIEKDKPWAMSPEEYKAKGYDKIVWWNTKVSEKNPMEMTSEEYYAKGMDEVIWWSEDLYNLDEYYKTLENPVRQEFIAAFFFSAEGNSLLTDADKDRLDKLRNPDADLLTQAKNLLTLSDAELAAYTEKMKAY